MTAAPVHETRQHYEKAPILEAVIDFRTAPGGEPSLEKLGSIDWGASGEYPTKESVEEQGVEFGGPQPAVTSQIIGFRYTSSDKKRMVQVRANSFTFSRLPQYDRWEPFCEEARRLWGIYVAIRKPELVTRVAVRYINRLELPLPITDFKTYLRNVPEVSSAISQGLSGFVLHLRVPQPDLPGGMLVLNEGLLESPDPRTASVLLDIDVFHPTMLKPTSQHLWDAVEVLHSRKNEIFEASITEETRKLIR